MPDRKGNAALMPLIVAILVLTAAAFGWIAARKTQQAPGAKDAPGDAAVTGSGDESFQTADQDAMPDGQRNPEQSVSSSAQSDPSGSQTYENGEYGFRFQYPAGKRIKAENLEEEGPGGAVFYAEVIGTSVDVLVARISKGLRNGSDSLSEPDGMTPSSQEDTTIAGLKGRIHHGDKEDVYVVAKNGYQYFIQTDPEETVATDKALQMEIVKSFEFTR